MAALDIDAALRWFRFKPQGPFPRRPDSELPFAEDPVDGGQALLLDTCVYIDQLHGRTPERIEALIQTRLVNHSTAALQELLYSIGALDPSHRRTGSAIAAIRTLIQAMPIHRMFAPDPDTLGRAAMLAGLLCRVQRYSGDSRMRALMDATLFLQAQKLGLVIVTRNIGDFDILLQLIPNGRVRMYRTGI